MSIMEICKRIIQIPIILSELYEVRHENTQTMIESLSNKLVVS